MTGSGHPPGVKGSACFVTLEGGEGAGKSTLAKALAAKLEARGAPCLVTREPGGSPKAETIRSVLLAGEIAPFGPFAEALMFQAARIDHLDRTILPALRRGEWVISDRFADSTRAYQGALGRLDPGLMAGLERAALGGFKPALTIILDLPASIGLARAEARRGKGQADRFESEGRGFHERLREAYLRIAEDEPERCVVIDAAPPADVVAEMAWQALTARLGPSLPKAAS